MLMIISSIICKLCGTIFVNMEISSDNTNTKINLTAQVKKYIYFLPDFA